MGMQLIFCSAKYKMTYSATFGSWIDHAIQRLQAQLEEIQREVVRLPVHVRIGE